MINVTVTAQCTILILEIDVLVTSTKAINKDMEELSHLMECSMREKINQVHLTEKPFLVLQISLN